ncbi:MAG: flagellar biosynthesis protein FlhA [Burkholderiales bacterium]|nr:flagellar biosynthesis protein FlhA [Burkholderiales bacterium]
MNTWLAKLQQILGPAAGSYKALAAPVLIVMVLAMMVLPLPAFALDVFFTFNIATALMVMLVAAYMIRPLDFAAFPTVLLLTTLLRLSLNVASSRVVLMDGHNGPGAAGQVIEAFGHFLIGGNFAVGIIVFAILVVINFVVVTKGAERIAEVGARFTLDAMPGKQMAIDADLNAGLIDEKQAKQRRAEVQDEAEFFGSMDGASKFVRGDAIAGILILFINIVGGFVIGVAQHDLTASEAASTYILLAVGDALVAQIPALLISVAAAMVVSRVGKSEDVGTQILGQMFKSSQSVGIAAVVIGMLGVIPGMPHVVFLLIAGAMGALARWLYKREHAPKPVAKEPDAAAPNPNAEASWDDLQPVDTLGMEVGYRLIALVDKDRGGDLLNRIKGVRKKFAQEVGFLPPAVHVRDNLELKPSMYRLTLRGAVIGEGEAFPGMYMAINPGHVTTPLQGQSTIDPAFGLPAIWIDERQRENAQMAGYTVVDSSTVVATHLSHLMQTNAARLLGRLETQALVEHVTKLAPKLIEDVVPKMVGIATLQKILQLLLDEGVHIRDMRSIVEALAEHGGAGVSDPMDLARRLRIALAPAIVQQIYGSTRELDVIAIEPELERLLSQALNSPNGAALDPGVADHISRGAADAARRQEDLGHPACLLVPDGIRVPLARLLKRAAPRLRVLGHSEIPDTHSIRIGSIIGATA